MGILKSLVWLGLEHNAQQRVAAQNQQKLPKDVAIRWLEQGLGVVATEFEKLVAATLNDEQLLNDIDELIEKKKQGAELDKGPPIPFISTFVDSEIARLSGQTFDVCAQKPDKEVLSAFFRETLDEVWG